MRCEHYILYMMINGMVRPRSILNVKLIETFFRCLFFFPLCVIYNLARLDLSTGTELTIIYFVANYVERAVYYFTLLKKVLQQT